MHTTPACFAPAVWKAAVRANTMYLQQPLAMPHNHFSGVAVARSLVAKDDLFDSFMRRYKHALASPHPQQRQHLLDYYSQEIAHRLPTREAALQLLAVKLAHLWMQRGFAFDLHITEDILGEPVTDYANRYVIADTLVDKRHGCVAFLCTPHRLDDTRNAIVLFRGTASFLGRDVLARRDYPAGHRADLDIRGVAKTAFEHNRHALQGWVHEQLRRGRRVTLLGHSLGGAFATRLLASLTPAQQGQVELIAFNTPGLDATTIGNIANNLRNIAIVRHVSDFVCKVGRAQPTGRVVDLRDRVLCRRYLPVPHGVPQLAIRQLRGEPGPVLGCRRALSAHGAALGAGSAACVASGGALGAPVIA